MKGLIEHCVPIHESFIVIFNKFAAAMRGVSSSLFIERRFLSSLKLINHKIATNATVKPLLRSRLTTNILIKREKNIQTTKESNDYNSKPTRNESYIA
jgi:hypothetical protein